MTFCCNGEPLGRVEEVELEGVDISDLKVWKDETFTAEVDTSGWSKEHWQAIFGLIPIIRCKDCMHNVANRQKDPLDTTDYSGADIVCDYFMTDGLEPEDFCSHAERKEKWQGNL